MLQVISRSTVIPLANVSAKALYEFDAVALPRDDAHVAALMRGMFKGHPDEQMIRGHFVAFPSLREAAHKLLCLIGTQWKTYPEEMPLFMRAVTDATAAAVREGYKEGHGGHAVIGSYLAHLCMTAAQAMEHPTKGMKDGKLQSWPGFGQPLPLWADQLDQRTISVMPKLVVSHDMKLGYAGKILFAVAEPATIGLTLPHLT